jgi:ankyrin repeat protein
MKRKRNCSNTYRRHGFTSSNSNKSVLTNDFGKRRKHFASFNTIKKNLINAIENEKVERVKEILKMYERSHSKKQKSTYYTKKQNLLFESLSSSLNEDNESQPMDIDSSSSSQSEMSVEIRENDAGKNYGHYITSNKIIRKITWSSFRIDKENKDNVLHYACRCGKACLIDALLDTGYFDINEPNFSQDLDSCLTIACDEGQLDTAKILIARGADVNYENRKSKTPLILATELIDPCDTELVKILLLNNALVNKTTSNGNTALLSASKYGNIEMIAMLLHANANINWEYNDGASPLMRACYYNHANLVRYLIMRGALIESKNIRKETPLYIASFRGYLEIVKILIERLYD